MKNLKRIVLTVGFIVSCAALAGAQGLPRRPVYTPPRTGARIITLPGGRLIVLPPPSLPRPTTGTLPRTSIFDRNLLPKTPASGLGEAIKEQKRRELELQSLMNYRRLSPQPGQASGLSGWENNSARQLQAITPGALLGEIPVGVAPPSAWLNELTNAVPAPAAPSKARPSGIDTATDMEVVAVLDNDMVILCDEQNNCRRIRLKGLGKAKRVNQ